ncbi:MAG: urea transporter [Pseudomonas sp.]|uniref:urea transporter n=1 Tax=Pseudomonas sp. TaxID=306 RepID=UPI0033986354
MPSRLPLAPRLGPLAIPLLRGAGQVFLQGHAGCGLLVLLALAWGGPGLLGAALLGTLASGLTARLLDCRRAAIDTGVYGYNGLLLGLLLGLSFTWTPLLGLAIVAGAAFSGLLLRPTLRRRAGPAALPAYTWPFVTIGWSLLALGTPLGLSPRPGELPVTLPFNGLNLVAAPFRSLAQVVFLDSFGAGLCLWLGLLWANARLAGWALCGASGGLLFGLWQEGSTPAVLAGLAGYNPALAALALGRQRTPLPALCGAVLSCILQPGFIALGLPALTAPFILACWLVLASQRLWSRMTLEAHLHPLRKSP